ALLGCPPAARVTYSDSLIGTVSGVGGRATRIIGLRSPIGASFFDPSSSPCGVGGTPPPFSFIMLRNDVPTGTDVATRPLDGATVTFASVSDVGEAGGTTGVNPTPTLPTNFRLSHGLTYAQVSPMAAMS